MMAYLFPEEAQEDNSGPIQEVEAAPVQANPVENPRKTKKQKVLQPLRMSDCPSVTLHKGGGRIVISPDDIISAFKLEELRTLIKNRPREEDKPKGGELVQMQLLSDVNHTQMSLQARAWTLMGEALGTHPVVRLLKSYGLSVSVSPTLQNWLKKEEKRVARDKTPFLLPEYKDTRSLFDKVESGMVLTCKKDFLAEPAAPEKEQAKTPGHSTGANSQAPGKHGHGELIFAKGCRYQVVDTSRSGQDGVIKIFKEPISPEMKLIINNSNTFEWTTFHENASPMETYFSYDERVIYDPEKCVPAMYPGLVEHYRKKLEIFGDSLFDHSHVDIPQMATKENVADLKLMRLGKTREGAVLTWLWGSDKVAWIGPRNARIFTERDLQALSKVVPDFGKYVIVNSLEDLKKPGKFYLMTYSWVKGGPRMAGRGQDDPEKKNRRQRKGYLRFTYKEGSLEILNEHKCPYCGSALAFPYIRKTVSKDPYTGKETVLTKKPLEWKHGVIGKGSDNGYYGYLCHNPNCVRRYDNRGKKGAAWKARKIIESKGFDLETPLPDGKLPVPHHLNVWCDIDLKVHAKCDPKRIKGRMCQECGLTDGTWVPPVYRRIKDKFPIVVVDEIHTIKSEGSDVGKAIRTFRGKHHLGMTGTLMTNTPSDSYWPLHWIFKGGSASFPYQGTDGAVDFYNEFCEYAVYKRGGKLKDSRKMLPYLKNPIKFWELMAPKVIRRNYEDPLVLSSMAKLGLHIPKLRIHRIESTMHPLQAALMVSSINHFENQFNQLANQAAQQNHLINPALVISQMTRMRIAATCPEHFNKVLANMKPPCAPIYHGPLGGGKMNDIKNIVMEKTMMGEKVVILSGFIAMRESVAKELAGYNPIVFDSSWGDEERKEAFDTFREDPTRQLFIAGTLEIREGVDLSPANSVICTDLLWQPGIQSQAWSRALTPTKDDRTCDIYLFIAKNTVDEHVYNTFYAKVAAAEQALDRKVINMRASALDIRWFVDRVLSDRAHIVDEFREAGEDLTTIQDMRFDNEELLGDRSL